MLREFTPTKGVHYVGIDGELYFCIGVHPMTDGEHVVLHRDSDDLRFVAVGIKAYDNGVIVWDHTTGGAYVTNRLRRWYKKFLRG